MQRLDIHWGQQPAICSTGMSGKEPYLSIVSIQYVTENVAAVGSGWFITPGRIVTSAHVLQTGLPSGGKFVVKIFGKGGIELNPSDFAVHPHLDLAKIELTGNLAAGIPARAYRDGDLLGRKVAVAGRPLDPNSPIPPSEPLPSSGVVWFADLISGVDPSGISYKDLSTVPSHSGSPVLALNATGDGYVAIGIHRADQSAVRITPSVRTWLYS